MGRGLARRRHDGDLIEYEVLVPETGQWILTSEGAAYFTGIGGVTDAIPITPAEATEVEQTLLNASRAADGSLPLFESGRPARETTPDRGAYGAINSRSRLPPRLPAQSSARDPGRVECGGPAR